MKRLFKILLILMIVLFITSCEKKEYKLIELTSGDLYQLLVKGKKDFVFATINVRNDDKAAEFKKVLKDYTKSGKTTIYYLDSSDLLFMDNEMLYSITKVALEEQYLYVVREGNVKVKAKYEGKNTPRKYLSSIHFDEVELPIKDSEKKKSLAKAKEAYEEGFICTSYQYLQEAWTLEGAKKFYRDHDYFKLINFWRTYVHLGNDKAISKEIAIYNISDTIDSYYYSGSDKKYTYPTNDDYDMKYFYIKDNIIYTSEIGENKYKKQYEILELKKDYLRIKEGANVYSMYPFSYDELNKEYERQQSETKKTESDKNEKKE